MRRDLLRADSRVVDDDRAFRQSQLDAAVRFCGQILEPGLAVELSQAAAAARAAEQPEPEGIRA